MKKYFGEYIREQAIKNLLSAQARIAEIGSASEVISLTKFVLKISNKFIKNRNNKKRRESSL